MEAPQKRCRKSVVWEHFHLETPNKVRCMYCYRQLAYFNNTSSMMRHLRSTHPAILQCAEDGNIPPVPRPATDTAGPSKQGRQRELDEALVDMVVKDLQPFTIVEDEGFMAFVNKLDPSYVLPSRKALKTMVTERYNISKEKTMEDLKKADFVSLTADMWSSINMDGYLGVTCHYITPEAKLATVVLGVRRFYQTHTAQHLMEAKALLMAEWGITTKVQCMVTDNASNMILSAQLLNLRHVPCFAHNLNLIVKKALDQTPLINEIRQKARKIVGLFRSSCKAKDKLVEMQGLMGRPALKLMQEVDTRWNSTYDMLQRLYEQREPVGAALSNLNSDTAPLTSFEYNIIQESLSLLQPFKLATTELSEEQRVSASKLIPLYRMLQHKLSRKKGQSAQESTAQLVPPSGSCLPGSAPGSDQFIEGTFNCPKPFWYFLCPHCPRWRSDQGVGWDSPSGALVAMQPPQPAHRRECLPAASSTPTQPQQQPSPLRGDSCSGAAQPVSVPKPAKRQAKQRS
ncbi:zinc finger BED domain-containing protein 4-like [Carassius auratus]|uniref:Zinc finger BED domain-containing protein 4-like n=1 Tax=Carassius auratus TaxID=7957 RepID=A0A6P6MQA9_CARAU|nr:zinc finger BED domain-containing protein 4-like [Carassius auratus]